MKIFDLYSSLPSSWVTGSKSEIDTSADIESDSPSCSAAIPKYFTYLSRFITPGAWIAPSGEFARTTTGAQHDNAIFHSDWEADTKKFYQDTLPALGNLTEEERKEYLGPIEEMRSLNNDYYYSGKREFSSTSTSEIHKEKKSELNEIAEKAQNGSEKYHQFALEDSDYPFRTCNGVEEIRLNSYVNQKKWYEDSIAYLDYQMSRPGFWKREETEIIEVIKQAHKLMGKNYSQDPYPGKFRKEGCSVVFDERFYRLRELHGTSAAVQKYLGERGTEKEIALVAKAIDNPSKPHTKEVRQIIQKLAFSPPPSEEVDAKMKELILGLKQETDLLKLAVTAHQGSTEVHPFVDRNGRVARAFMNSILMNAGKTPPIFVDEDEYISSIKKGETAFRKTVEDGMKRSEKYYEAAVLPTRRIYKPLTLLDRVSSPSTKETIDYLETAPKQNTKGVFTPVSEYKSFSEITSSFTFKKN